MKHAKRSPSFEAFVASVLEPMTWSNISEYSNVGALLLLKGDEREEAEELLFERLRQHDGRAASALAELGRARAIAPLRALLADTAPGGMRLAAAQALLRLGDDSGLCAAQEVALHGEDPTSRQLAVSALATFPGGAEPRVLELAIDDPDPNVRSAAARVLIASHQLQGFNVSYQDKLGLLQNRCSSQLASVRAAALAELREIFVRHERGESPEQLGLTWRAADDRPPLAELRESFRGREEPWREDFAVDVIAQLTGMERTWAEDCLWHFLPTDPRSARALSALGVTRAIPALRELLPIAQGEVQLETAIALWKLARDAAARAYLEAMAASDDASLAARAREAL